MNTEQNFRAALNRRLTELTGTSEFGEWQPLGGGVGGKRWRLSNQTQQWFMKCAPGAAELFAAEADGLQALVACDAIRVPGVLDSGELNGIGYLILEWLPLAGGGRDRQAPAMLGRQLARQHLQTGEQFGWRRDNFIGATPQINTPDGNWIDFFRERRLGFQLQLAAQRGHRGRLHRQGERLLANMAKFFTDYLPVPSLLHGDLWGGNWGALANGEPVIFDPAIYYGDREADLAMTELFGGFPAGFYTAYDEHYPRDSGYRIRRDLYNLYHVLNHLNLFGEGYLPQCLRLIDSLLSEAG